MNDSDRDSKDSNLPPQIWGTGSNQIDTASIGDESPFAGTAPPQVTDGHSPESAEASRYASTSYSKNWADISDVAKDSALNRNDLDLSIFDDEEGLDLQHDAVSDLMNLSSSAPLPSLKSGEETSTGDSPLQNESQPSGGSPDTKSTGSGSSIDMWQYRFEKLQEYKTLHGNFDVPQTYGALGAWVNKQRNEYRHFEKGKKSQLTQQRISQLDSIGFRWAKKYGQELWEATFKELIEYKEKVRLNQLEDADAVCFLFLLLPTQSTCSFSQHGHCNINTKEGRLGRWVTTQRSHYKKNKISEENKAKLDSIGFCWNRNGYK